jgi:glyoxylase-like metal-dependent hydrolase (beta-lactamase superfamily II)
MIPRPPCAALPSSRHELFSQVETTFRWGSMTAAPCPTGRAYGRFRSLYDGLVAKVFGRLPDQTRVYPGHGGDTTLGAERPHLEEWRARGW